MKYSKPATRVELVSIGANAVTIDDLLTVRIGPKINWLKQGVSIGDAGIHPTESLLDNFKRSGLSDFFEHIDLEPIAADGLENLQKIGGDGDGHEYVVGVKSQQFYVLWHDPTEFEMVAKTANAFIQWVIRERSDHLKGCPWEVFATGSKQIQLETLWHRDQVDPGPILGKAREVQDWSREYISPLGFELLNADRGIDLRFKKEHRGHNSHIQTFSARKMPKIESYLRWLSELGFGRVWQ